jgi:hypothetical protein
MGFATKTGRLNCSQARFTVSSSESILFIAEPFLDSEKTPKIN